MRRFVPRRFRHSEDEPPYDSTHQHKIPGPWPIVALAVMMLVVVGLVALLFGQQAKQAEFQKEVLDYMEGRGDRRDAEFERTRALLCAVLPQLEADDAGVLERTATAFGCPQGPASLGPDGKPAALPTPIDGARSNSTGDPTGGDDSPRATGRGDDAAGDGPSQGRGDVAASGAVTPERTPQPAPGETEPPPDSPPESGGGSSGPGIDADVRLCLPGLGCLDL